jgi:hypothetical protein
MNEYVWASNEGRVLYAPTGAVEMTYGQAWFADDPFVISRPDLFSKTPVIVQSTVGKVAPDPTALDAKRRSKRA